MGLKPKNDSYSSDKASALKSTQAQLNIIRDNVRYLIGVDPKGVHRKFIEEIGPVESLEDWERAKVEKIYELTMKGYGLPSVEVHVDKKPKGLRFG